MSRPTLGTIGVSGDLRVRVPVDDLGGNALAQVDYAVAADAPPPTSQLWKVAGRVDAPGIIETPVMLPNTRVWVRASGRVQVGSTYSRTSLFTDTEYIEVDDTPRFVQVTLRLDNRRPVIEWQPGPLMLGVLIEWSVYARGMPVPETFDNVVHLEAAAAAYLIGGQVLDESETVAARVTAYEGWDSGHDMVYGEAGQQALFIESPGTPDVEAHAFTHEHDGSDPIDLGALVIESPNGTRWRLVVDDAGVLSTEPIVDSSSGPSSS